MNLPQVPNLREVQRLGGRREGSRRFRTCGSLCSLEEEMPYRGDVFAPGHYYHIYNRGAGKGLLFFNSGNYEYCLRLVKRYYQQYGATVIAYCLMPNHYHFCLR